MSDKAKAAPDDLTPGTVLRGKYRVERFLGAGGMGRVLEGFHLDLERRVAIKVLHPDLREHAELVTRFIREGRAAAKIEGEHVAKVLDVDKLDDGTPFLVMEFLEGADLSSVRKSGTPLRVRDAVEYVLQACQAISDAHAHGIIHRDVKPANLFLAKKRDGSLIVKVLDFGISKVSNGPGGSEPSMTRTSIVMGSAEYMSPEQMLSTRDVDVRTDVWALGTVLFELVTARPPFAGETMTQVCAMVMSQEAPSPRLFCSDISPELEQIILTCLQKDRERRFASVSALARALATCLRGIENGPTTAPLPDLANDESRARGSLQTPPLASSAAAGPSRSLSSDWSAGDGASLSLREANGPATKVLSDSERRSVLGSSPPPQPARSVPPNGTAISSPGFPSGGGLDTNVPVSNEPVPSPPMRSSVGALLAIVATMVVIGLAVGGVMLVRRGAVRSAASSDSSQSTSFEHDTGVVDRTQQQAPSGIVVEPAPLSTSVPSALASASPLADKVKGNAKGGAAPITAGRPTGTVPPATSSKPIGSPKPVKTSGID